MYVCMYVKKDCRYYLCVCVCVNEEMRNRIFKMNYVVVTWTDVFKNKNAEYGVMNLSLLYTLSFLLLFHQTSIAILTTFFMNLKSCRRL